MIKQHYCPMLLNVDVICLDAYRIVSCLQPTMLLYYPLPQSMISYAKGDC